VSHYAVTAVLVNGVAHEPGAKLPELTDEQAKRLERLGAAEKRTPRKRASK
jgi:hypothetical protein